MRKFSNVVRNKKGQPQRSLFCRIISLHVCLFHQWLLSPQVYVKTSNKNIDVPNQAVTMQIALLKE